MVERGDLAMRVSPFTNAEDTTFVTKVVNRLVLAFIGAVRGVIAVLLVVSTGGPSFVADLTLLSFFFGYLGLFGAVDLMLRVVAAVVREGLN